MALLDIITIPDHHLRLPSRPVSEITPELKKFAADMAETMYAAPGVGLAAAQVAVPLQVITIDVSSGEKPDSLLTLFNAKIVENSGRTKYEEGCLSIPGVSAEVERFSKVVVEYMDIEGKQHRLEAEGLLAITLQHEIDHQLGKLFIDYLQPKQRAKLLRESREFMHEESLKAHLEAEKQAGK